MRGVRAKSIRKAVVRWMRERNMKREYFKLLYRRAKKGYARAC